MNSNVLTCSLTEIDALAEVAEVTFTAWERASCVKIAVLGIEARGRKPGVEVFAGTL